MQFYIFIFPRYCQSNLQGACANLNSNQQLLNLIFPHCLQHFLLSDLTNFDQVIWIWNNISIFWFAFISSLSTFTRLCCSNNLQIFWTYSNSGLFLAHVTFPWWVGSGSVHVFLILGPRLKVESVTSTWNMLVSQ